MTIFDVLSNFGNLYDNKTKTQIPLKQLNCSFFGLLFTAQWCPGCRNLQKILPRLLQKVDKSGNQLKIITIRIDDSSSKFAQHYFTFKKILPQNAQGLANLLKVRSYPKIIVYNMNGKLVSLDGANDMQKFGQHTLRLWKSI